MVFFLKCPVKIGEVVKTYGQGDIQNRSVSLLEQFYGFFQAQIVDVFDTGHVHMFFEKAHKMIVAKVAQLCQI